MALEDEIQKIEGWLGSVDSVIGKGIVIFDQVRETVSPTVTRIPDTTSGRPEPISSKPIVTGQAGLGGSGNIVIAAAIIGYLLLARK